MNKYVATWVYLDSKKEKSKYPNTGGDSTSPEFQAVYWRCIILFYETSLRFHKDVNHLFFTNTTELPIVDGFSIKDYFESNNIEVVSLKNNYPLPDNYFERFRNQFFEFSIIEYIASNISDDDELILLDSDCVFSKSLQPAFDMLHDSKSSALTYVVSHEENYEIHGVSGNQMRQISRELGLVLDKNPFYSGGELLFAKGTFFKAVADDFPKLYANLIKRHKLHRIKFNEEAHVLSYYYYKLNAEIGAMDGHIKRMWTNRNYFRNIKQKDKELTIWHLPNEKRNGIHKLFSQIASGFDLKTIPEQEYKDLLYKNLLVASNHKRDYYKTFKSGLFGVFRKLKIISK